MTLPMPWLAQIRSLPRPVLVFLGVIILWVLGYSGWQFMKWRGQKAAFASLEKESDAVNAFFQAVDQEVAAIVQQRAKQNKVTDGEQAEALRFAGEQLRSVFYITGKDDKVWTTVISDTTAGLKPRKIFVQLEPVMVQITPDERLSETDLRNGITLRLKASLSAARVRCRDKFDGDWTRWEDVRGTSFNTGRNAFYSLTVEKKGGKLVVEQQPQATLFLPSQFSTTAMFKIFTKPTEGEEARIEDG